MFETYQRKNILGYETLKCCPEFLRPGAHLRLFRCFQLANVLLCSRSDLCVYIAIKIPSSNDTTLLVQNKLLRRHELMLTFGASIYVCQSCRHVIHSWLLPLLCCCYYDFSLDVAEQVGTGRDLKLTLTFFVPD